MECGEQCVIITGIVMMPESCADNWGTVSTQVEVSSFSRSQMLPLCMAITKLLGHVIGYCSRMVLGKIMIKGSIHNLKLVPSFFYWIGFVISS